MLRLLFFLIFLIASVLAGVFLVRHPGYLLLVYHPWTVQMPLWFATLSLLLIFVLFYVLIHSIDKMQLAWFRMKNWMSFRRTLRSQSKTQRGLAMLIEAKWKKAEALLLGGLNQSVEPLINYLGAAKAAQEQGAYERRDSYMQKAYQVAPHEELAIGIAQAELEISQHQWQQALATLNHLREKDRYHPRVLKLLEKVSVHLGEWENLLTLVPFLRKAKLITSEQRDQFEKNIYCEIFRTKHFQDLTELHQFWNQLPRHARKNPDIVAAYLKQLLCFKDGREEVSKEIEDLIRRTLKYHWQPELVKIYATLNFANLNRQLVIAGAWLKLYGERSELLLLLGELCTRSKLWGRAKDYFEKCLSLGPCPEASIAYGQLLEDLDDPFDAMKKYREGLENTIKSPVLESEKCRN